MEHDSLGTESTTSYPLRWCVYGSGPRLSWEWTAGAVLCFFVVFPSYDVFLLLYYRIAPGPWLKVGGMMVAANTAKRMASLDGSTGGVLREAATEANYLLRSVGRDGVEPVDDASHGGILEKTRPYGTEEDRLFFRLRSCMDNLKEPLSVYPLSIKRIPPQIGLAVVKALTRSNKDPTDNRNRIGYLQDFSRFIKKKHYIPPSTSS